MLLNDSEYFSDILRSLGFVRADEAGLFQTDSPYESSRGAFLAGQVLWLWRTFAVDQAGWVWVAYDLIDLTPYGFRNLLDCPFETHSHPGLH
ncbi:MAG: hypothetical protein AAB400_05065 [Patescibacteria group bacterium]